MANDRYDEQALRQAGFSDQEIAQDRAQVAQHLSEAGFSSKEVGQYFGAPPDPDMKPMKAYVAQNLKNWVEAQNVQKAPGSQDQTSIPGPAPISSSQAAASIATQDTEPKKAATFLEALEAGYQMSVDGLMIDRQKMPDVVLPENAGMAMRIAAQAGTLWGDVPAMAAGTIAGGTAAAAATANPIAAGAGAGFGAFALPAAMRTAYIEHLKKGDIQSFGDFYERTSAIFLDALKNGTIGAVTEGAGGLAASGLAKTAAPAFAQTSGTLAAKLATMTTVGKAMEGQVPQASDFVEGAILLAGLHGVTSAADLPAHARNIQDKLQDIYAATGLKPDQVGVEAHANPVLKQELLSSDKGVPTSLQAMAEKPQPGQELLAEPKPPTVPAKVPDALGADSDVLGKGFAPPFEPKVEAKPSQAASEGAPAVDFRDPKAAILSRIGEEGEKPKTTFSQIYTKALDDLNPVKQVMNELTGGTKLPASEDPYVLARLARASSGKAEVFIDHGPLDFDTLKPTGTPGLKQILAPFKGDLDGFKAYAMAQRSLELQGRGIETGFPEGKAEQYVAENSGKYEKGFRQLVQYQNDSLNYLKEAGVLSEDARDKILSQNQNYIPFNRIQEDGSAGGSGRASLKPIKSIYGSELKLSDPIESIIKNTFAYMKVAEENRAKLSLVDLAQNSSFGKELISKVPPTMQPIEVKPEEISKYLASHGILEGDPETFNIFRPLSQPLAKDEIAVMRDGKREVYNVGEDVAKAVNGTSYDPPTLLKWASYPAKWIRTGAVETPDFLFRHLIRDQANAFVYSKNGYVPFYDALRGMSQFLTEGESYQKWLAGGGGMANIVSMDRDYIQNKVFELSQETGLIDKTKNLLRNPLQIMQAAAEAITSAPRIGEFMRAQEAGKDLQTSAYDSRNVTIDNQRKGSSDSVRALSMITAFWNTHIQGVDRMVQAFKDEPQATATKMALSITLPSVALWFANKDDERYQQLPRWQKDLFWIFTTPDTVYRIPKPFEQGVVFGSMFERTLEEYYQHNPHAFKDFGSSLSAGAIPNPVPNALMPAIEQFANKSWMTGGNIIPHALENVAPEYQYTPYTSDAAKGLGKMIRSLPGVGDASLGGQSFSSPPVIENYVRAWGGSMGQYALQLADKALSAAGVTHPPPAPEGGIASLPVVKAFVIRYPSASSQHLQDFYENYAKSQVALKTYQHLLSTGDPRSAETFQASPQFQEHALNMMATEKALGTMGKAISLIHANPDMTPNDKRQQIDGLYFNMIQAAKLANQAADRAAEMAKARE